MSRWCNIGTEVAELDVSLFEVFFQARRYIVLGLSRDFLLLIEKYMAIALCAGASWFSLKMRPRKVSLRYVMARLFLTSLLI